MIRQPIPRAWYWGLGLLSVLLLAAFYTYLSYRQHVVNPLDKTVPTWSQLWDGVVRACSPDVEGEIWIWEDAKATSLRLLSGLFLASVIGVVLGLGMGCYAPVEAFFMPPLSFVAKIPPTAMVVIFLIMINEGLERFVAMLCFGLIPTLAQTVYAAVRDDVPDELLYKAHTLGASQAECIWDVIFKHILPKTLEAIRLLIGPAMVYIIAAEWMLADVGFGYRMKIIGRRLDMSVVFFYLVVLAMAGYLMDHAMIWLRRKLCPWYAERRTPPQPLLWRW